MCLPAPFLLLNKSTNSLSKRFRGKGKRTVKKRNLYGLIGIILTSMLLVWSGTSLATGITFSGSSGTLSASAAFDLTGNTLNLILTNTSSADVLVPSDVLSGLFFNTTHTLTPIAASLNGSTVSYGSMSQVGAGWQYKTGISTHGENSGISAAGLGIFGSGNFYNPGNNLAGIDYGILSVGDNPATGNTGVTGKGPLIKNSVEFTFNAAPGFTLDELGNSVVFQYGSSLTENNFSSPVPEPATILLLGSGLIGIVAYGRKKLL